jgi:DNA sulfur modification protein DndC
VGRFDKNHSNPMGIREKQFFLAFLFFYLGRFLKMEDTMRAIIEEMKEEYSRFNGTFVIMFSGGKDSSLVLTLWWQALKEIPKEYRKKPVYVISGDTMVETPLMTTYVRSTLKKIQKQAEIDELPIITKLVQPEIKNRYFYKVLGRGNLPPTPNSNIGRWCTGNLKQTPTQKVIQEIIKNARTDFSDTNLYHQYWADEEVKQSSFDEGYKVHMSLGVRNEESARRRHSIEKHAFNKKSKFARHSDYKEIICYHPIKFVTNDELLFYFLELGETLPFGVTLEELERQYGSSFAECGLQHSKNQGKSCGIVGSRSGCWVCPLARPDDPMLLGLIQEGMTTYSYLLDWKKTHIAMRNDVRYREVKRRVKEKNHQMNYELQRQGQSTIFDLEQFEYQSDYYFENYQRAESVFDPGGFTVQARRILLEYLLYIQEKVGEPLIEEEEVKAILAAWEETDGIVVRYEELSPKAFEFDGTISFDANGKIKKTDNPYPIFFIDVELNMSEDELIHYLKKRQQQTQQSFFCFPSYEEFKDEKLVWNKATFVVCDKNIKTKEEATEHVWKWLGWIENTTDETQNISIRYLFTSSIGAALTKKYERLKKQKLAKGRAEEYVPLIENEDGQLALW